MARNSGSGEPTREDGDNRRRLVRILVVLVIVVPLVVEGLTFAGLVGQYVGDGDDGAAEPTTATADPEQVGVGDELLAGTPQRERVTTMALRASRGRWVLTVSVAVNNTDETAYRLDLLAVTTDDGTTVENGSTVRLDPGARGVVTGRWALPEGSLPRTMTVAARAGGEVTVRREVRLERIAVRGS